MFNEDSIMSYTDFNNIENKIYELTGRISNLNYTINNYTKKSWSTNDYLIYTYLNNIETGIKNLGSAYFKPYGWNNKKTWSSGMSFSYKDVNRWWNNLNLIEERLNQESNTLLPSNTLYPNDNLLPH